MMKGIILAGGKGTRLSPLTIAVSKQLLPIYDKPMIYYPLSALLLADIRDILIICNPDDESSYKKLLGNGANLGIKITYAIQPKPEGLAQAFIIGEEFIENSPVCLVLGDNIFYGDGLTETLQTSVKYVDNSNKARIFGYEVSNPSEYGVVSFDGNQNVLSIDEKPEFPKSNFAAVGLYFYPADVVNMAKTIEKSQRGEYEITSLNDKYLKERRLSVEVFGRGFAWLDTGSYESLIAANNFVSTVEARQGLKIACLEEISFKKGWINSTQLEEIATKMQDNPYKDYLLGLLDG